MSRFAWTGGRPARMLALLLITFGYREAMAQYMPPVLDPHTYHVGSVGQPRNGDNRASYVILDDRQANGDSGKGATVIFRRVDYDFERTIAKINLG